MRAEWKEISAGFLKVGATGFGGPAATMALMEEEFVRRRRWVDGPRFAEMLTVCKLLPGPVATQLAIFLGLTRGGRIGGLLAGACFILPSFVLVLGFAAAYRGVGAIERSTDFFGGLQAAALALIFLSAWQLGRPYARRPHALIYVALSAAATFALPSWEALAILSLGLLHVAFTAPRAPLAREAAAPAALIGAFAARALASAGAGGAGSAALPALVWTCFKAGAFVFGTGLAILPVLEGDVVHRHGWLTSREFMDAIAVGQVTPGPVVISATFIGFQVAGLLGAALATAAIFLPGFINILLVVPRFWNTLRGTDRARRFVDGAIPAVIGGILASSLKLGLAALHGPREVLLFAASLALALFARVPAWALIPGAGLAAWLTARFSA